MRFGKQNKTWAAFGRKLFGENSASATEPPVEDDAARAGDAPVPELEEQVMPEEPFTPQPGAASNDPSQSVLISLGRFKRHIQHATGAPEHAQWPGECLQELLKILNIAAENGWDTLREAVTDTARVLCSYERARRTAQCLPFLRACDDALSMMIGDIIIDNETPTVRMAWQKHYQGALEVMRRDGIVLVEDEAAEDEPAPAAAAPVPATPVEPPAPAPVPEAPAAEIPDAPFGGVPEADGPAPEETAPEAPESPWEDNAGTDPEEESPEDDTRLEVEDEAPVEEDLGEIDLRGDVAEEEPATEERETTDAPEETESDAAPPEAEEQPETPETTDESPEAAEENAPEPPEAEEDAEAPEAPEESAETPAPPAPPAPRTVEEINRDMQSAILAGDVAGAKLLALHLAAALARTEADHVSAALDGARSRLDLNGEASEDAARRVREAEERVRLAEEQIAAREADARDARARIGALDGEIAATRGELADLDARIAALQEERAAAAQRLRDQETARTDTVAAESLVSSEVEALMEEEEAAREFLEKARARVADLEEGRRGILGDILALETELEERRRAIGEITRPLDGGGAAAEDGQRDGMLF